MSALKKFITKQNSFRQVTEERLLNIDKLAPDDISFLNTIFDYCLSPECLHQNIKGSLFQAQSNLNNILFFCTASLELFEIKQNKAATVRLSPPVSRFRMIDRTNYQHETEAVA